MNLILTLLKDDFAVCKLRDLSGVSMASEYCFLAKTPDEISLVCPAGEAPGCALTVEPDWRAFKVEGLLDFSLVGILAHLSNLLAEKGVSLFAVSTFDTDYILVKSDMADSAKEAFTRGGCTIR